MNKYKKDDVVIVIAGKDKGSTGKVQKVTKDGKLYVEGISVSKKHMKPTQNNNKGGIVDITSAID